MGGCRSRAAVATHGRITSAGYSYDANGALTADPTRGYAYDGFGRLTAVSGTTTASYTLDGAGNRLAQTVAEVGTSFDLDLAVANPTILADGWRRITLSRTSALHER